MAAEKSRLRKILSGAGIRLSVVVSDLHGKAAQRMTRCLIEGGSPEDALAWACDWIAGLRDLTVFMHLLQDICLVVGQPITLSTKLVKTFSKASRFVANISVPCSLPSYSPGH